MPAMVRIRRTLRMGVMVVILLTIITEVTLHMVRTTLMLITTLMPVTLITVAIAVVLIGKQ